MLGNTNQIFKKIVYAGIVASFLLAGAAGKAMSAPDSNSIIVDDIEFYIETDKSFYYLGENVEMLYRLTKLWLPSVTIPCMEIPPINILVLKDGQTIREKHPLRYQGPIDLRLWPKDPCEITFCWDMNDFNDVPVEPGTYDVLGVVYDGIGLPDVGVQITILSEPRTITVGLGAGYDFNTIQAAIDDANDGDTIIVADGTYTGNGNRDIDFLGKAITLRSENGPQNCIIDCQGSEADKHRGFYFHSSEDANSVVDRFTITNGYGPMNFVGEPISSAGGAIFCSASSPTISNCIINSNSASNGGGICCGTGSSPLIKNCNIVNNYGAGGGIYCVDSSPEITNCVITDNVAPISGNLTSSGAGIATYFSSPIIENCIISDNTSTGSGGGLYCFKGSPAINDCTISRNAASDGGGIMCYADCVVIVSNCIFWGNTAVLGPQISLVEVELLGGCPTFTISYSDIQGGATGVYIDSDCTLNWEAGNIDVDPNFADTSSSDPNEWDFHLKSQAGRWEPSSQTWVKDEVTSPCIDAGDPVSPIGDEPFPNGGIINMGAYGGTNEASKSYFGRPPCEIIIAGDINGDCIVNYLDFRLMALNWLRDESQ